VSRPKGQPPLDDRTETAGLRKAFAPLVDKGVVEIALVTRATPGALQQRLAKGGIDVLHFVGHGHYDASQREGFVVLEDDHGGARPFGAEALGRLVCTRGLSLVFLNACETGRGGPVDWNRGTAPSLVAAGVPAVV